MTAPSARSSVRDFLRAGTDIARSRTSILNQLQWTMAILIAGIALLQLAHSANWLSILLAVLLALNVVVFLIAFLYFMLKRPHSLRSESFDYKMSELIQKRAGEMGAGLYEEVSAVSELKVHAASDSQRPEEQNSNE